MKLTIDKVKNKLIVTEWDGRECYDVIDLDKKVAEMILDLAERKGIQPEVIEPERIWQIFTYDTYYMGMDDPTIENFTTLEKAEGVQYSFSKGMHD